MRHNFRGAVGAAFLLPLLLLSTACGDDNDGSSGNPAAQETAEHDEADVEFATMMIPHHEQAIAMAEMALESSSNPDVLALAEEIKDAQQPEIDTMTGWLEAWGEPLPDESMDGMDDGDMGDMDDGDMGDMDDGDMGSDMDAGMMSDHDMQMLGDASGSAFDAMFLKMMIKHHEGAIDAAEVELSEGEFQPAKDLAQSIAEAQAEEIGEMQSLLVSM